MTWREQKSSPGTIIVHKNPPLGTEKEVKSPTPRHKVREFHKYIYELWHYLKWKALWTQQIKRFFQWGDWLLKYISFGGHQSQTIERIKALYDMYKCMSIIFWEKGAWNFKKKIFRIFVDSFQVFYS